MQERLKQKIRENLNEIISFRDNCIKIPIYLLTRKIFNITFDVLLDIYFYNKIIEKIFKALDIKERIYVEKEIDIGDKKIIIYDYADCIDNGFVTKLFLVKWDKFRRISEKSFSEECYEDLICINSIAEILIERGLEIKGVKLVYINKENFDVKEFKSEFLKGMLSIVQSYAVEFLEKGSVSI